MYIMIRDLDVPSRLTMSEEYVLVTFLIKELGSIEPQHLDRRLVM